MDVRGCIQKFPDWPPGARTANGTVLCLYVQLYHSLVNQSSEFCRHNPSCCFSPSAYYCFSLSIQSGNFWIHRRMTVLFFCALLLIQVEVLWRYNTTASRTALGSTQPPIQWVPGALSLGVKRPGREADHSPPSSAEVKNTWNYNYPHQYAFQA
jgi:hypothetical protein